MPKGMKLKANVTIGPNWLLIQKVHVHFDFTIYYPLFAPCMLCMSNFSHTPSESTECQGVEAIM